MKGASEAAAQSPFAGLGSAIPISDGKKARTSKRMALLASIFVFGFLLLPASIVYSAAQPSVFQDLVTKAQKEGAVVWWDSVEEEPIRKILKQFENKFHIRAEYERWEGVARQQRTLIELKSGRAVRADVMSPGREFAEEFAKAGVFRKPPFDYLQVWPDVSRKIIVAGGMALSVIGEGRAVAYNPKLIREDLVPKTWDDCARPELKGKAVLDSRHKLYALHWNRREWFLQWLKKMLANDVKLMRGQTSILQLVSSGAYGVLCGAHVYSTMELIDKGAPNLKLMVPGELLVELASSQYIRNNSSHPYAAQLLIGWLASSEGQYWFDKTGYRGFPWVPDTANAKWAKGKSVLLCDVECTDHAAEMAREYTQLLGLPVVR